MEIEDHSTPAAEQPLDHTLFSKHHIDSFNFLIEKGLGLICRDIRPLELITQNSNITAVSSVKISLENVTIGSPSHFPFEARLTASTYSAPLFVTIKIVIDDVEQTSKSLMLGEIPLMLLSDHCLLKAEQRKGKPLHLNKEDDREPGGYFVVNGLEKILRTIIVPRKNYPLAVKRQTFHLRRKNFSNCAVSIKSTNNAYKSQSIYLHYTFEGNMFISIMIRKVEYLFPLAVIMKAIEDISDQLLVEMLTESDSTFNGMHLLKDLHQRGLTTHESCLEYLGFLIRDTIGLGQMKSLSDEEVGKIFLDEYMLIHLKGEAREKLKCLAFMAKKLWKLVQEELEPDNLDALTTQEFLTSGQLYGMFIRERFEEFLLTSKALFLKEMRKISAQDQLDGINSNVVLEKLEKAMATNPSIGKKIEYLLATGNLKSVSGLDLMQSNGYSIIAERLNNARFWSHLRSIHRGAYFVEMKTTQVRKLLPENWGFMCPVHTPDGGLCGLLNHLAMGCFIQTPVPEAMTRKNLKNLAEVLVEYGMIPDPYGNLGNSSHLQVVFDGRVLGIVPKKIAEDFVNGVRKVLKSSGAEKYSIFNQLSMTLINPDLTLKKISQFPGIYLSLSDGRPLRRVYNANNGFVEIVDPFEQSYMMIAVNEKEFTRSHTHIELSTEYILSELAAQTPFMVHNQSPRNMYQCQMAKQTMGNSTHALAYRTDNKMYQITYSQKPLISCRTGKNLGFEDFPSGINAVVAVLSYTGYDIEDAMIINKSSYERGFMHGNVYKTFVLDTSNNQEKSSKKQAFSLLNQTENYKSNFAKVQQSLRASVSGVQTNDRSFATIPANPRQKTTASGSIETPSIKSTQRYDINNLLQSRKMRKKTDIEGLPRVGEKLLDGDVKLQYFDNSTGVEKSKYYKDLEHSFVESVIVSSALDNEAQNLVGVKLRYNRNPVVGDKFSSRHGQKGVMSIFWPQTDMPFSEQGITPDIIINPNAFPSRMTIGMLIESLAGKTHSLLGSQIFQDAFEPANFEEIGEMLRKQGFNPLGTETLYSGVYGVPLKVEIYQGVVYYQRLRHMIKDKAQARSTGPIDSLTRQPIKGRKKGGGIRLGEMERDALIAHGVSYIIKERLMDSSDASDGFICASCGSLLGCFEYDDPLYKKQGRRCLNCENDGGDSCIKKVKLPYVLRYLTNELAAMNIKLTFRV